MQTPRQHSNDFLADALRNEAQIMQLGLEVPDHVIPNLAAYAKEPVGLEYTSKSDQAYGRTTIC